MNRARLGSNETPTATHIRKKMYKHSMSKTINTDQQRTPLPTEQDLARIKSNLIQHEQHSMCARAFQNVDYEPGLMSAVVGPAGVGKTTLLSVLSATLRTKFKSENPGDVPVIETYMEASEEGVFNWKNFYRHGLLPHLNAPLDRELSQNSGNPAVPSNRRTKDDLRNLVGTNLRLRNTRVILIDEAHHVALGRPAPIMLQQLEVLKSFATTCKVHLVLCGPYQLMSSISLNSQLARRITVVHFPRYSMTPEDRQSFYNALCALVDRMAPWTLEVNIEENVDFFYERSLGCIGLLKPWLDRAAKRAMEEGSAEITSEVLKGTAKLAKELQIMVEDIKEGEAKLIDTKIDWDKLKQSLGLEPELKSRRRNSKDPRLLPGDRKPKRDQAGELQAEAA